MTPADREYILRNLCDLDISNLRLARVTRQATWEAARRLGITLGGEQILRLSDELNDMLEAAGGPRCWACGKPADAVGAGGSPLHWCVECHEKLHGPIGKETDCGIQG